MLRQGRWPSIWLCIIGSAVKSVNSYVCLQAPFCRKRLCTLGAIVGFSPVWHFKCFVRVDDRTNDFVQRGQLVPFLKSVKFHVSLQVPFCYKRLRTLWATVGFLAVWTPMKCFVKPDDSAKDFVQWVQRRLFSRMWTLIILFKIPFVTNDSVH